MGTQPHLLSGNCCSSERLHTIKLLTNELHGETPAPSLALASESATPRRPTRFADMIVRGAIATGDADSPTADAMAVKDGRIAGIGSLSAVEGLSGPDTEIVSQSDGVITPGFIEPHMHLFTSLLTEPWVDCSAIANPTLDDVVATIKKTASQTPAGQWVAGKNFDPSLYPGEPDLTIDTLDQVSTDHPIAIANASMHFMYANSKAFELAGITAETPDPESGTFYRRDGKLTGVVGEAGAMLPIIAAMPHPSQSEQVKLIVSVLTKAASVGITSLRDAMTGAVGGPAEFTNLQTLNQASRLPTRVTTAQMALLGEAAWKQAGINPGTGDDMVRAIAWKVVSDGSNQGRSGYLHQPYVGQPDNCGHANFDADTLTQLTQAGIDAGWQVMTHANGDAAIDLTIAAYKAALGGKSGLGRRHRIEHCSLASDEQLATMAELGLSPSFLMNHVYYWGKTLRDNIIGPERANRLDPVASALAAGLRPSLHSDYSVSPMQPLVLARTAALREMNDGGEVLNAEECVSSDAALRTVTADAAWQIHADDAGVLAVGKWADWAVMSENPWMSDPAGWDQIKTYETRIGGQVAWSS